MNEKEPMIKTSFTMEGPSGVAIDLDEITKCLVLEPTKIRTLNDWPEAIKNPKTELPDDLRPRCCWTVELDYEDCLSVCSQFEKMLDILCNKVNVIKTLKDIYGLKTHFEIVISAHHDRMPEMFLTSEIIAFIASIDAEVGVDTYLD
jgi:hypothetical protein